MALSTAISGQVLRVLVVDDDPLARRALRDALGASAGVEVAGEASGGQEAVDLVLESPPDVVLMDIDMPEVDGVTATLRILRAMPEVRIIMMSTSEDEELGILSLRAGANGFLAKDVSSGALIRALAGVHRGEAAISRALTLALVKRLRRLPEHAGGMRPVHSNLTTREWQVLDLMMAGASTEAIAGELVLSIETVRSHIKHVLAKLGTHSRAEAVEVGLELRHAERHFRGHDESAEELDEIAFRRVLERLRNRPSPAEDQSS